MSNLVYLNEIVDIARKKSIKDNRPIGDVLKEIIESLKEKYNQ